MGHPSRWRSGRHPDPHFRSDSAVAVAARAGSFLAVVSSVKDTCSPSSSLTTLSAPTVKF